MPNKESNYHAESITDKNHCVDFDEHYLRLPCI